MPGFSESRRFYLLAEASWSGESARAVPGRSSSHVIVVVVVVMVFVMMMVMMVHIFG